MPNVMDDLSTRFLPIQRFPFEVRRVNVLTILMCKAGILTLQCLSNPKSVKELGCSFGQRPSFFLSFNVMQLEPQLMIREIVNMSGHCQQEKVMKIYQNIQWELAYRE
ncbi:hypothetical protein CY35_16G016400 [Sphagnum magellanicum]|jgi:hypothetical protein|nr:hypothetical protein CY35_16G016400 [Sphagnum magellanicum]